jgi:DNA-binding transcriptional ArsR family regulator
VVAWGAARVRGGLDLSVLLALRDAFAGGEPRRAGPGHGRDAPATGGDPHGVPPEDPAGPLIAAFVDWFKGPGPAGEEPAVRAALAHYHILSLRPLSERYAPAARLIETVLLDAAGFRSGSRLMAEYYLRHAGEYEATRPIHPALAGNGGQRKNDPTRFVAFCLDALIYGLREVEERVAGMLRRVVLDRHYEELRQARRVTARQHALLRLLLDGEAYPVGIRSLCRVSPYSLLYGRASEQTARRDLKRLTGMGLLAASGEGFVLNRCALSG